ncbi:MAG: transcription elongation GreA/GreB family factor [Cyclobacteriaceae bacterium]|jgi:transcription elongation GreA/GreB family factor
MKLKSILYNKCLEIVAEKIRMAETGMKSAQDSANAEGKSTAGDKYDTARAMSHRERDLYAKQLAESLRLKKILDGIDVSKSATTTTIESGSIVETSLGNYFMSVGLGLIKIEEITVFALSPISPIGKLFLGKSKGESVIFNGKKIEILNVN